MAFFSNATAGILTGQEMIRGQVALRHTGLLGVPIVNVENACASASSAFHLAWMAVGSGAVDVALAVGAEKLTHQDKAQVVRRHRHRGRPGAAARSSTAMGRHRPTPKAMQGAPITEPSADDRRGGREAIVLHGRLRAEPAAYMERSGATRKTSPHVAVKNHQHGALNPKAQYREPRSLVDDVLASREISWPLTLLMCSPIGDGAAAASSCSDESPAGSASDRCGSAASVVLVSGT